MKKRILLLCILTIFFSTGMEGCPELDPINYVEFTVTANIQVFFVDTDDWIDPLQYSANGTQLRIRIQKAGGEHCTETVTHGIYNATLTCTHKVYKEQPVVVSWALAALPEWIYEEGWEIDPLRPDNSSSQEYDWNTIYSWCGSKFGSSCAAKLDRTMHIVLKFRGEL